ncbi:hypothetical protein [Glycomyces sp. NPDC021274]|uniref:hypothetical protein n=1 Tax=Glycomyces sp. NPDC021274 TaxID=3155120 RepID=UPI0033CCF77F
MGSESDEKDLKFEIADQLRKVPMKAPAKTVMWDLLMRAHAKDAVIPAQFTPSLTDLAGSTCLGRSTVAQYLNGLEATGWLVRERPSVADALNRGRRTQYRLAIGSFDLPPELKHEKHARKPRKDEATASSPGAGLVQELDSPGAGLSKPAKTGHDGPGVGPLEQAESGQDSSGAGLSDANDGPGAGPSIVQELDSDSPGAGHNKELPTGVLSSTVQQDSSSTAAAADQEKPKTKPKKRAKKTEPQRNDVDQLCTRLADHIEKNSGERPEISEEWKRSARLLLDTDKRELDKALKLIDWCQADDFWHTNILSMPTFRKQFLKLRMKAVAEWEKTHRARPSGDSRAVSSAESLNAWTKKGTS